MTGTVNTVNRDTPDTNPQSGTGVRDAWLVYDGDCPFCSMYLRHVRVRKAVGHLHLVDARAGGDAVEQAMAQGFDLDQGMVLKLGNQFYYGAECMHVLASLGTRSGALNRLNAAVFASPTLARWIYPVLRAGRNATLALLGRRRLSPRPSRRPPRPPGP